MAPAAAAGWRRAAWCGAARGTPAATIRCPDGYAKTRPAAHLWLLGADALGRLAARDPAEACAAGAERAAAGGAGAVRAFGTDNSRSSTDEIRATGGAGGSHAPNPRPRRGPAPGPP